MTTTRNVANLEALAALFDTLHGYGDPNAAEGVDRYNQGGYGTTSDCGTYCCLAGWEMVRLYGIEAVLLDYGDMALAYHVDGSGPAYESDRDVEEIEAHAARSLGITDDEAVRLFNSSWVPAGGDHNDPAAAAEALRRLAKGHTIEEVTHPVVAERWTTAEPSTI